MSAEQIAACELAGCELFVFAEAEIEPGNHNYLFLNPQNTLVWPDQTDTGTMKGFRAYFYIPEGAMASNTPVQQGMPALLVNPLFAPGLPYSCLLTTGCLPDEL